MSVQVKWDSNLQSVIVFRFADACTNADFNEAFDHFCDMTEVTNFPVHVFMDMRRCRAVEANVSAYVDRLLRILPDSRGHLIAIGGGMVAHLGSMQDHVHCFSNWRDAEDYLRSVLSTGQLHPVNVGVG